MRSGPPPSDWVASTPQRVTIALAATDSTYARLALDPLPECPDGFTRSVQSACSVCPRYNPPARASANEASLRISRPEFNLPRISPPQLAFASSKRRRTRCQQPVGGLVCWGRWAAPAALGEASDRGAAQAPDGASGRTPGGTAAGLPRGVQGGGGEQSSPRSSERHSGGRIPTQHPDRQPPPAWPRPTYKMTRLSS